VGQQETRSRFGHDRVPIWALEAHCAHNRAPKPASSISAAAYSRLKACAGKMSAPAAWQ